MIKKSFILLFYSKILIYFLAILAPVFLIKNSSFTPTIHYTKGLPFLVLIFANFDGAHYLEIARNGYHNFLFPFFPLYPLLMSLVKSFTSGSFILAGEAISHVSFFIAIFFMYKLLQIDKQEKYFFLLLAIILFFPTSFYLGAVYNDALFLMLATITIYFSRKKKWLLSGMFGALATLARLNGLALCFMLFLEFVLSERENNWQFVSIKKTLTDLFTKKIFNLSFCSILFIPAAFIGYLAYVQYKYNDWSLVFSSMSKWGQDRIVFPLQVFWRYFKIIIFSPTIQINYFVSIIELFFVLLYVAMMIYSFRKIRFSYWVFFIVSIIIPSLTGTFQGMPRYGLHLYPFFLALTLFLSERTKLIKVLYFLVSLFLLLVGVTMYTRGYFLA